MESPDLQAKYQKLAAEYSKLRAQNQVLKKALLEEQTKSSQLSDVMKSRDQVLRKAEQENDSLSFRNQQLTKRLTLLQEDLDEIESKTKRGRGKSSESVVDGNVADTDVFTEELQSKIQENARLQSELAEIETTYRRRFSDLDLQLETTKKESQKYKELLQIREKSANDKVEQLENERVRQEVVAQQREGELRALRDQMTSLQQHLNASPAPVSTQPTPPDTRGQSQPTHTSEPPSSNLSIPVQNGRDKSLTVTARNLIDSFDALIQELSESFAKFLCCYSTRVKQYQQETEVQQKLIEHLKSAASPWHSLASSYHQMAESVSGESFIALETLSGLAQVSQHVTACGASLRKALPLVVHWVCEGSGGELSGCRAGAAWSAAFSRLVSSWGSLAPYVSTLANQSAPGSSLDTLSPSAQGRLISMLSDRLNNFHAALREASDTYLKKAANEKDQPSTTGEARAANEEILNTLSGLSNITGKMSSIFKEQVVPSWNKGGSTPTTPSSPYTNVPGRSSSKTALNSITQDDGSGSLYEGAGGGVSPSDSTTMADTEASLMKQLALASSKLSQLEAQREHFKLDNQLLQCKFQKEAKRVRQLEKQLKGETASMDSDGEHTQMKDHSGSVTSSTSSIGEVQGCEGASDEREKAIRNYFTNRCSHLYMQLTMATSQAALYQNECEALMRRLAVTEENRTSSEQEVDTQREKVNNLKETLQTTARNYEEQISTMSEHLADLNEKITAQSELIEHLKFEIKNKRSKK
ncbi:hypothetical protein Pcinc_029079 [Petrolisthes cinctipes]|uniref:Protein phosphatase 1 regulatory subunit 21 n=1 Tax=Petrolisthes cinctipes TaxID=88211 RepID=A0AAE1F1S6_PETCI|nr:hypothetical protein Pcinc_029079 [Petrolisthes cinctipes]